MDTLLLAATASGLTSRRRRRSVRRSTSCCPQGLPTATRTSSELGWEPRHCFDAGLVATDLNVCLALACPDDSHHGLMGEAFKTAEEASSLLEAAA